MQYVYLLYDHDEYGPEHLRATLDRSLVPALAEQHWPEEQNLDNVSDTSAAQMKKTLGRSIVTAKFMADWLLANYTDEQLADGIWSAEESRIAAVETKLQFGWGGAELTVVRLEE